MIEQHDGGKTLYINMKASPDGNFHQWLPGWQAVANVWRYEWRGKLLLEPQIHMTKGQISTAKRYLNQGIITAYRGWPTTIAALAHVAAKHPFLHLPTRARYKTFRVLNCRANALFAGDIAEQFASICALTKNNNIPVRQHKAYNGDIELCPDYVGASRMDGYQNYSRTADLFAGAYNTAQIQAFMKEAIKTARAKHRVGIPAIPEYIEVEINQ